MPPFTEPTHVAPTPTRPSGRPGTAVALIALAILSAGGCSRLRLPAIDPTGSCLFATPPTTTTLALPGSAGEAGCLSGLYDLGGKLKNHFARGHTVSGPAFEFPEPAFPEPEPPPKCPTPATPAGAKTRGGPPGLGACRGDGACVPSAPCEGDCQTGPPAVLFGHEIDGKPKRHLRLPDRGKRGCILLTPQRIIAPVGGEVILLSGVCGTDGTLQIAEPLEWMLTPDSVGTFIQVGDDAPGLLHRLTKVGRPTKQDGSFARGVTSTKRMRITRGNLNPNDDVQLEKGQTWISISSPSEGTSRVTVLAPESECWDQRKATATIYWIDARWTFPAPQREPAGTPVALTTRVTKAEGTIPAEGWRVRYEIMQPELARFAGTDGSPVVEVDVNASGNATAELLPLEGTSGNAVIDCRVIRPGDASDNMPSMTIGRGQAYVTWSSPQLRLRAGAPQIATYDEPFDVVANVANPGNQPAENVQVQVEIPPGARVVDTDAFAQVFTNRVVWDLDVPIPPQQQLDLGMRLATRETVNLRFEARGDGGLFAEDAVRVNVFRPSLEVNVTAADESYETGDIVRFDIEVFNSGDRPLDDVSLRVEGDRSMLHREKNEREVLNDRDDPLQPGESWATSVEYIPTDPGQRCVNVEATADGGQRAAAESCVRVINPAPVTPAVSTTLTARQRRAVGETLLVAGRVINSGRVPLRNVEVNMTFPSELRPIAATEPVDQSRLGEFVLSWRIPELPPGADAAVFEGQFEVVRQSPRAQVIFTARSAEGATDRKDVFVELLPGAAPPAESPPPRAPLPGAIAPPTLPDSTSAPPRSETPDRSRDPGPRDSGPTAPPLPPRSDRLVVSLLPLDNPARVGDPIRFSLSVTNDRDEIDGNVRLSFRLPDGVSVERATPTTAPEAESFRRSGDTIVLEEIRSMRAGETVNFRIVLRSNQTQSFDMTVTAESRLSPGGVSDSARIEVLR